MDLDAVIAKARNANRRRCNAAIVAGGFHDPILGRFVKWRSDGAPVSVGAVLETDSPAEATFWSAAKRRLVGFLPQVQVGIYRVDFGNEALRVAIEIDGHDYHSSPTQRTNDAVRQRWLERVGWRVIRFTGSEVRMSPESCVGEVLAFVELAAVEV